jgi:hypothetical protein
LEPPMTPYSPTPEYVLAPCPFCGGPAHGPRYEENEMSYGHYVISCGSGCGCTIEWEHIEGVVAAWNRRAAPEPAEPSVPADGATDADHPAEDAYACVLDAVWKRGGNLTDAYKAAHAFKVEHLQPILAELAQARADRTSLVECSAEWARMYGEVQEKRVAAEAENERLRAENAAIRELMSAYNLGGWTDALEPMKRALAAERDARELRERLAKLADAASEMVDAYESRFCDGARYLGPIDNEAKRLRAILSTPPSAPSGEVLDTKRLDWLHDHAHQLTWNDEGERIVVRADDGGVFVGETWRDAIDTAIASAGDGA